MSNNLQCPMTFIKREYNAGGDHCKEDQCAWWVEEGIRGGRCAIVRLAVNLDNLADATLGGVVDVRVRQ